MLASKYASTAMGLLQICTHHNACFKCASTTMPGFKYASITMHSFKHASTTMLGCKYARDGDHVQAADLCLYNSVLQAVIDGHRKVGGEGPGCGRPNCQPCILQGLPRGLRHPVPWVPRPCVSIHRPAEGNLSPLQPAPTHFNTLITRKPCFEGSEVQVLRKARTSIILFFMKALADLRSLCFCQQLVTCSLINPSGLYLAPEMIPLSSLLATAEFKWSEF
jgi:hypothetical protein